MMRKRRVKMEVEEMEVEIKSEKIEPPEEDVKDIMLLLPLPSDVQSLETPSSSSVVLKVEDKGPVQRQNKLKDNVKPNAKVRQKGIGRPRKYLTRDDRLKARAESRRQRRALAAAVMTPEKHEEYLRKHREYNKRRRETFTPEQRQQYLEKQKERNARKKESGEASYYSKLTKEEKLELKNKRFMAMQAKLASMTKEEREEYKKKRNAQNRKYGWKLKLTEEQKKKRVTDQYFRMQAKLSEMTEEEREEHRRKNREAARKWRRENLTGEKRERYLEYLRNFQKKNNSSANDMPEERQKKLWKARVYKAAGKLKKELETQGVQPEEIQVKIKELKERMFKEPLPPLEELSAYKPRPGRRKAKVHEENGSEEVLASVDESRRRRGRLRQNPNPNSSFATETEAVHSTSSISPVNRETDALETMQDFEADYDIFEASRSDNDEPEENILPEKEEDTLRRNSSSFLSTPPVVDPSNLVIEPGPQAALDFKFEDVKCPHCISYFPQKSDLINHISSEHPRNCWKCPMCKQVMLSSDEFQEHFKSDHAPKIKAKASSTSIPSRSVKETTQPQSSYKKFNDINPKSGNSKSFNCIKCDNMTPTEEKVFSSLKELNEHVKSKHLESYWPCSKCDILKYSERSLKVHEKICRGQIKKQESRKKT